MRVIVTAKRSKKDKRNRPGEESCIHWVGVIYRALSDLLRMVDLWRRWHESQR